MCGYHTSTKQDIEFITIACLGDAFDFGNLGTNHSYGDSTSSPTRGIVGGGNPGINNIEYVQIMTTGDGVDFGDFVDSMEPSAAFGCSNGHGGLG